MATVNIFTNYKQEENDFTNGLIGLLELAGYQHPKFTRLFFRDLLHLKVSGKARTCRVLQGIPGTPDAELCGPGWRIWFESKIESGTLRKKQVREHLKKLRQCPEKLKRLVLLTPDDRKSAYVKEFLALDNRRVLHLGWRTIYDWLDQRVSKSKGTVFFQLVRQFLARIHDRVFQQDIAGVVTKIAFGDNSQVYADTYLEEMKDWDGTWWNTPRLYKSLDGTGRKLIFYDGTRKEITAEVEIRKVRRIPRKRKWCWRNYFAAGTLRVFRKGKRIPLSRIRSIPSFEGFGMYRKDRTAYRNITREQYRMLMKDGG